MQLGHYFSKNCLMTLLGIVLAAPASSWAAVITTNEAAMDAIFSQTSFGASTVDIRFNPSATLVAPALTSITTSADLNTLFGNSVGSSPTVNMFFVDSLDWCGSFNTSIVGCANKPGNKLVVESSFAAGSFGAELGAHELGHNLNLGHVTTTNLMTGFLNGSTLLTTSQVNTILASPLIQTDTGGQRFISITPILVTAVPLPGAFWLLLSGIGLLGLRRSGRRH